jgi:hypothetical protein
MSQSAMKKAIDALEREQVMAQDSNGDYTINVTPKHITEAIVELRAALATSQAVEPEPVANVNITTFRGYINHDFDYFGNLPNGCYSLYTHPAPAKPLSGLLKRATELHEKGNLPWSEAEKLALSEFGIDDTQIDEIAGNCANSNLASLLDKDDLREYIRTVIVYSSDLSKAQPAKPLSDEQYTEIAHRTASRYTHRSDTQFVAYTFLPHTLEDFVRKIEAARGIVGQS